MHLVSSFRFLRAEETALQVKGTESKLNVPDAVGVLFQENELGRTGSLWLCPGKTR